MSSIQKGKRLESEEVKEILRGAECDWLDFKQQPHTNDAEFLHDFLCMANSSSKEPKRYIVFGVEDKKHAHSLKICGTEGLKWKDDAALQRFLQQKLYRLPELFLHEWRVEEVKKALGDVEAEYGDGKFVIFLEIEPQDKHFCYMAKEDYCCGKKIVKAGVFYTRNGSGNSPIDKGAEPKEIKEFARKKFEPEDRDKLLCLLVEDYKKWTCSEVCGPNDDPEMSFSLKCSQGLDKSKDVKIVFEYSFKARRDFMPGDVAEHLVPRAYISLGGGEILEFSFHTLNDKGEGSHAGNESGFQYLYPFSMDGKTKEEVDIEREGLKYKMCRLASSALFYQLKEGRVRSYFDSLGCEYWDHDSDAFEYKLADFKDFDITMNDKVFDFFDYSKKG